MINQISTRSSAFLGRQDDILQFAELKILVKKKGYFD